MHGTLTALLFLAVLVCPSSAQRGPLLYDGNSTAKDIANVAQEPGVYLVATPWRSGALQEALSADAIAPLRDLQRFFASLEREVSRDRNASAGNVVCNVREQWAQLATSYLERRGLFKVSDKCVTMRRLSETREPRIPDLARAHAVLGAAGERFRRKGAENWTSIQLVGAFDYDTDAQRCELRRQFAVRAGPRWFVLGEYTDLPLRGPGAHGLRALAAEHVRAEDAGSARPFASLRLRPLRAPPGGTATTLSSAIARPPAGGRLGMPELERNEALHEVLTQASRDAEHADENVIRSNIAILVLPLLMNVVPVALFADVNALGMLVYSALTDVLTAVPLAIKGGELVWIARRRYHASAAYYAGEAGVAGSHAAAELFVASCRSAQDVDGTGVAFLVIAFAFMAFGVTMEFVALRWMRKRRLGEAFYLNEDGALGVAALLQQNVGLGARHVAHPHEYNCICMCHSSAHERRSHSNLHHRSSAAHSHPHADNIPPSPDCPAEYDSTPHLPSLDKGQWG